MQEMLMVGKEMVGLVCQLTPHSLLVLRYFSSLLNLGGNWIATSSFIYGYALMIDLLCCHRLDFLECTLEQLQSRRLLLFGSAQFLVVCQFLTNWRRRRTGLFVVISLNTSEPKEPQTRLWIHRKEL